MLLRNHGTLALGKTCADAFARMYFLERACSMQVRALSGGEYANYGLVTLDAHLDMRDGVSNGSPVRQLLEDGLDADHEREARG